MNALQQPFVENCYFIFDLYRWPRPWEKREGLTTRNTHVKHESCISYHSKVMADDKFFGDNWSNRQTGQKQYVPALSMQGRNKECVYNPAPLSICQEKRTCPFFSLYLAF